MSTQRILIMNCYEFDLIVSGLDIEADVPTLAGFEDRIDDITFGAHGDIVRAVVTRDAPSLGQAIRTAIADVESLPGAKVLRVDPDDFVSQAQIAHRLGRSRQSVSQWVAGTRGPGAFPPPAFESGHVALWRWSTVSHWLAANGAMPDAGASLPSAAVISAANALLEARRAVTALDDDERASIAPLMASGGGARSGGEGAPDAT